MSENIYTFVQNELGLSIGDFVFNGKCRVKQGEKKKKGFLDMKFT